MGGAGEGRANPISEDCQPAFGVIVTSRRGTRARKVSQDEIGYPWEAKLSIFKIFTVLFLHHGFLS